MIERLGFRSLLAGVMLTACSAAGYTVRLGWPPAPPGTGPTVPAAAAPSAPATAPPSSPAPADSSAPGGVGETATPDADGLIGVTEPEGRFALRHGDSWRAVAPERDGGAVTWLVRLERGQPDAAVSPGAKLPPDGARLELGIARVPEGTDLTVWLAKTVPLDPERFSVTIDGQPGSVGAGPLPAVFREGQVLPFYGRWREWVVPSPGLADTVYLVRARAYGAKQQLEMAHCKVVASTVQLR